LRKEYYLNKLYPFQDYIFEIINRLKVNLYLTGGTALSRFYLNHRYSDDLDFFANCSRTFIQDTETVIKGIKENSDIEVLRKTNDFIRVNATKNDIILKIDFVNDIEFRSGETVSFPEFNYVDNPENILSNKITSLGRLEPKDVVDILFLWRRNSVYWVKAFEDARKKEEYIDPLDIGVILDEFPKEYLKRINWVDEIDYDEAIKDIKLMAKEILLKGRREQ